MFLDALIINGLLKLYTERKFKDSVAGVSSGHVVATGVSTGYATNFGMLIKDTQHFSGVVVRPLSLACVVNTSFILVCRVGILANYYRRLVIWALYPEK